MTVHEFDGLTDRCFLRCGFGEIVYVENPIRNTGGTTPRPDNLHVPVGYDREWTTSAGHRARQRVGYSHERGELIRFVIQLEYRLDEEWATVVRYDHDLDGEMAHDVTEEGLHIDIYRDGEKHATEYITGPIPAGVALDLP